MPDNSSIFKSVDLAKNNKSPVQQQDIARWDRGDAKNIDFRRWNQYFPYQFLVVEESKNGDYTTDNKWIFTLPFPPESLDYHMPMATTLTPTLSGTIEENNGIPIRPITLTGTLGVMPLRGHADIHEHTPVMTAIFSGTVQNGVRLANNFITPQENLVDKDTLDRSLAETTTTGYYQMRLFKQFLEDFTALKKTKDGAKRFLAFAMNKDEALYLVSLNHCTFRKTKDSPLEYMYNLTMQAYKRIKVSGLKQPFADAYAPSVRDPNKLAQVLNSINKARKVLADAVSTLEAVRGDIDAALFEPVRQLTLFCKQLIGLPLVTADLPKNILSDCRYAILEYMGLGAAFQGVDGALDTQKKSIYDAADKLGQYFNRESQTGQFDQASSGDVSAQHETDQDEAMDPFHNPSNFYDLFSNIPVSALRLSPKIINKINGDRAQATAQTRLDFEKTRDQISQVLADFEAAVNLGDATFNATYSRPAIPVIHEATKEDYKVIYSLNDTITQLGFLAATREINQFQVKSVDVMAGLAARSGIAFQRPISKFSVPFPYGSTLEQLSYRYLGTPDRWLEIVALNGLRTPYVDETGFSLPLLTNGKESNIIVSDISNLSVGQQVTLYSSDTTKTVRRIDAIKELAPGQYELTLDGDSDLDRYTTYGRANLHTFLPGTVNSQQLIYIPSNVEPGFRTLETKAIPGINEFDPLIEVGGIDMLLSDTNDIIVTSDGDNRWAIGMANIIQMTRIELSTLRGKLMDHPGFGLPITPGISIADTSATDIIQSIRDMFTQNPSFEALESAKVSIEGGAASISIAAFIKGTSQLLPLTFRLS